MRAEFKERVKLYREAGIAIESLSLGCSVKVDLYDVLYPAIQLLSGELSRLNLVIAPREDAAIMRGESAELTRLYLDVEEPKIDPALIESLAPDLAIVLVQLYMAKASSPDKFAEYAARLYRALGSSRHRVWLGKGHSIVSTKRGSEFFMVDFLKTRGTGYILANNDTIQVIDPSEDLDSPLQAAVAVNNALNDLYIKGVYKDVHIAPVYDAPQQYLDGVRKAVLSHAAGLGKVVDAPQPNKGYLLLGATAWGYLDREPPTFYKHIDKGFVVLVTRPFGELAYFTTYVAINTDDELLKAFEREVMTLDELEREKKRVLELMATPNVEIAKVIYKYLPELGDRFRPEEHIAATIDVSGPGIFVFKEVGERAEADVELFDVPLLGPKISRFAAQNYIMPDATAGTNGAVAIFVHEALADELLKELRKIPGLSPRVIGRVVGRGEGKLIVPRDALDYISSAKLRGKLEAQAEVLSGLSTRAKRPGRAKIVFEGEVQGVGFRPLARAKAKALGLYGYAKNLPDGRVEVVVEGDVERIKRLAEVLCPEGANCRVSEMTWEEYRGEFKDFDIL
ncbi:MAG: SelD-related putative sulfur metabolism protein [Thermoproteus sp. AZ2]|jgi:selenophosphate synthase/acylphosphatase|uniref:SelD-related putative sulfur metabolism protein n=1 Tax=Thermoproteus sp. AZ2 TaxID=1609232 RepID=A0ACC6V029_9CREN|nr:MAG: acylphosphatase [Thermoproteus sp. AZ2]